MRSRLCYQGVEREEHSARDDVAEGRWRGANLCAFSFSAKKQCVGRVLFSSGCCGGDFLLLLTRSDGLVAESLVVVGVDWLVLEMAFIEIL